MPDRPEIAFAGRSNVGKSSLINTLTNRRGLAKTSGTPGRTRSINFFSVNDRIYFVDLPGYGFARVSPEEKKSWGPMMESYLSTRSNLKGVVLILDIRRDLSSGDCDLIDYLRHYGHSILLVFTKADKLSRHQAKLRAGLITQQMGEIPFHGPFLFSAKTREGREPLWKEIQDLCLTEPSGSALQEG